MIHERKAWRASFFFGKLFVMHSKVFALIAGCLHTAFELHVCCSRLVVYINWGDLLFKTTQIYFSREMCRLPPGGSTSFRTLCSWTMRSLRHWRWILISFSLWSQVFGTPVTKLQDGYRNFFHWLSKKLSGIMHLISIVNMLSIFIHIVFDEYHGYLLSECVVGVNKAFAMAKSQVEFIGIESN